MAEIGLVLITGGSGYVAGYCIAKLIAEGPLPKDADVLVTIEDGLNLGPLAIAARRSKLFLIRADNVASARGCVQRD